MGWYILAGLVVLLALPLLIPITARVRLEEGVREWSVTVAGLQIAPETARHLARYRRTLRRIGRPFRWIGARLGRVLRILLQGVLLLQKVVTWPVSALLNLLRRAFRKRRQPPPPRAFSTVRRPDAPRSPFPPEGELDPRFIVAAPGAETLRGSGEPPWKPRPPGPTSPFLPASTVPLRAVVSTAAVRAPSGASSPLDPGRDIPLRVAATLPFPAPSGGGEASLAGEGPEGGEEPRADEGGAQGPRPGEAGAPEEDQGEGAAAFEKLRESFRRAGGRWRRAAEGLEVARGYWRRYGRVARKLLRAVLLLGRGMLLVPRFKLFDARYSIGGDPAALGMALGWHHALLATIHPRLSRHIVFEPDFEERELAPRGSLHLVVVVWPWRFIPPILAFVARLPWLGLFKLAWREILAKRRQRSRPRT